MAGFKKRLHLISPPLYALTVILFFSIFVTGCGSEFKTLFDDTDDNLTAGIYWVESEGTVNYINFDGTGRKTIYTSGSSAPFYVDVDLYDDKVYWTDLGYIGPVLYYQIKRVGFDGIGREVMYSYLESSGFGPLSLAIDKSESSILWGYFQNASVHHDIWKAEISSDPWIPVKWVPQINHYCMYSMCVDSINRKIYYTANTYYEIAGFNHGSGNNGSVYIGPLDAAASNYDQRISDVGPAGVSTPFRGIAVDGAGGYVYYVFINSSSSLNIMRADLALSSFAPWVTAGSFNIEKIALDLKNRKIYWTSNYSSQYRIYRADLDTSNSNVEVFLTLDNPPTGIAIH
ncbi:MAG TPA: hypothetical protein PLY36_09900 [Spirochaetota bacterium]|nr:hypothetical protein [Spirochaetota bacterium]